MLYEDFSRYKIDILALQETKVTISHQETLMPSNSKLILFPQNDSRHRGIGFIISQRLQPYFVTSHQISDNVAYLDFKFPRPTKQNSNSYVMIRIVNAYGPTSPKATADPTLLTKFYNEL